MHINTKISSIPSSQYSNNLQSNQPQSHLHNNTTHTHTISNIHPHNITHVNTQTGQSNVGAKKYQHRRIHT